jgi:hypothetical protein
MRQFFEDMGERPRHAKLQAIDITQPFSKDNCYWQKRSPELTPEQFTDLINMTQYITGRSNYLDKWDAKVFKRINNYIVDGCPIMLKCFVVIKRIFEKLSTMSTLSTIEKPSTIASPDPCPIRDDYAGGAPMYPRPSWEEIKRRIEEFEARDREKGKT